MANVDIKLTPKQREMVVRGFHCHHFNSYRRNNGEFLDHWAYPNKDGKIQWGLAKRTAKSLEDKGVFKIRTEHGSDTQFCSFTEAGYALASVLPETQADRDRLDEIEAERQRFNEENGIYLVEMRWSMVRHVVVAAKDEEDAKRKAREHEDSVSPYGLDMGGQVGETEYTVTDRSAAELEPNYLRGHGDQIQGDQTVPETVREALGLPDRDKRYEDA